jgi:hypothetical protein
MGLLNLFLMIYSFYLDYKKNLKYNKSDDTTSDFNTASQMIFGVFGVLLIIMLLYKAFI